MNNPNTTSVGDVKVKDKIVDKFLNSTTTKEAAEISVNYTDNSGNILQDKISKEGKVSDSKITKRSSESIYKQAQRIKENQVRSDKFMLFDGEDYSRVFPDSDGLCKKGKYILDQDGKLVQVN
jgi:hypothetical protein